MVGADQEAQTAGGLKRRRRGRGIMFRGVSFVAALVVAALACAGQVAAQIYPSRTITLIVPFPPGGGNDTRKACRPGPYQRARPAGRGRKTRRRQRRHRHAAGRESGARRHTLVFANSSSTSINIALYSNPGYDVRRDFARLATSPRWASGSCRIRIFRRSRSTICRAREEAAAASSHSARRARQRVASVGRAVQGDDRHRRDVGALQGRSRAHHDVLGNHIPVMFSVLPPALGNIQQGKLHVIAVTTRDALALLPKSPTVAESGLPGFAAVLATACSRGGPRRGRSSSASMRSFARSSIPARC